MPLRAVTCNWPPLRHLQLPRLAIVLLLPVASRNAPRIRDDTTRRNETPQVFSSLFRKDLTSSLLQA